MVCEFLYELKSIVSSLRVVVSICAVEYVKAGVFTELDTLLLGCVQCANSFESS